MGRNTKAALLVIFGAVLLVAPPHAMRRDVSPREIAAPPPIGSGCEIVSFSEIPAPEDDEFRYCRITVVCEDGAPRDIVLKAKKHSLRIPSGVPLRTFFGESVSHSRRGRALPLRLFIRIYKVRI